MLAQLKSAEIVGAKIWCGEADQTARAFAEAARQKLEVLIVLGGDGTIRTAAEACAEKASYLIPLPGGTMNMLPRALYGDVSWEEALKNTLADPVIKILSGGRVEDNQFFVAAIIGAPALWVEARESLRERTVRSPPVPDRQPTGEDPERANLSAAHVGRERHSSRLVFSCAGVLQYGAAQSSMST